MKELFIKYFRDASSYQSIDPACFNLNEYTETWLINHKKQLLLHNVVGQSEQLKCNHEPKSYDKKHTSCKKCGKILQMKP